MRDYLRAVGAGDCGGLFRGKIGVDMNSGSCAASFRRELWVDVRSGMATSGTSESENFFQSISPIPVPAHARTYKSVIQIWEVKNGPLTAPTTFHLASKRKATYTDESDLVLLISPLVHWKCIFFSENLKFS